MPAVNPSPLLLLDRRPAGTTEDLPLGVRVRWSALELDAALASGSDPASSAELALRAAQLAEPAKRRQLARSINDLVLLAEGRLRCRAPDDSGTYIRRSCPYAIASHCSDCTTGC